MDYAPCLLISLVGVILAVVFWWAERKFTREQTGSPPRKKGLTDDHKPTKLQP
jgi:hypothetical protein